MKKRLIGLSLIALLATSSIYADEKKDYTKAEVIVEEESTFKMPPAGALVNALNKHLGNIKWNDFIKLEQNKKYPSMEDMVLNLGLRGADAYFLTSAKDSANLIAISTEINYLLNKIKINNKSLNSMARKAKLKEVKNLIKAKKWIKVQKEINVLQNNINNDFINGKTPHFELLNNIGGWIEGYRLAVEGFNKNYKAEKTEILLQNELIEYLLSELKKNVALKSFAKTKNLLKTLETINSILKNAKNDSLTKAQIEKLLTILSETKKYI